MLCHHRSGCFFLLLLFITKQACCNQPGLHLTAHPLLCVMHHVLSDSPSWHVCARSIITAGLLILRRKPIHVLRAVAFSVYADGQLHLDNMSSCHANNSGPSARQDLKRKTSSTYEQRRASVVIGIAAAINRTVPTRRHHDTFRPSL